MINYLINNIDLKLRLEVVSKDFDLNPSYCSTLFQKYYNCGFSDFVMKIRMKNAINMLDDGNLSIEEIAKKCGVPPFTIPKYEKQAALFKRSKLLAMLRTRLELEEQFKSGKLSDQLAVELFLIEALNGE